MYIILSDIVKETLNGLETKKEKFFYLSYVFKEWLIGGIVLLFIIIMFTISILNTSEYSLTVRIISEDLIQSQEKIQYISSIENFIYNELGEENVIDIDFSDFSQQIDSQTFMLQIAAEEIDMVFIPKSESNLIVDLVNEDIIIPLISENLDQSMDFFDVFMAVNTQNEEKVLELIRRLES